eukprot:1004459-Pleurochrysis_carterae.AAC.1
MEGRSPRKSPKSVKAQKPRKGAKKQAEAGKEGEKGIGGGSERVVAEPERKQKERVILPLRPSRLQHFDRHSHNVRQVQRFVILHDLLVRLERAAQMRISKLCRSSARHLCVHDGLKQLARRQVEIARGRAFMAISPIH